MFKSTLAASVMFVCFFPVLIIFFNLMDICFNLCAHHFNVLLDYDFFKMINTRVTMYVIMYVCVLHNMYDL